MGGGDIPSSVRQDEDAFIEQRQGEVRVQGRIGREQFAVGGRDPWHERDLEDRSPARRDRSQAGSRQRLLDSRPQPFTSPPHVDVRHAVVTREGLQRRGGGCQR
jgi:hypothetical protein